jgi:hypothetical protein
LDNNITAAAGYLINTVLRNGNDSGVVALNHGTITVMMNSKTHIITIIAHMTADEFYSVVQSVTYKLHVQGVFIGDIRFINGSTISTCQGIDITYVE